MGINDLPSGTPLKWHKPWALPLSAWAVCVSRIHPACCTGGSLGFFQNSHLHYHSWIPKRTNYVKRVWVCMCSLTVNANRNEGWGGLNPQELLSCSLSSQAFLGLWNERVRRRFSLLPADSPYQSLVMLRESSPGDVKKNKIISTSQSTALHSFQRCFNQSLIAAGSHSQLSGSRWSPLFSSSTSHVTRKWWRICISSKLSQKEGCWSAAVKHLYYSPGRKASSSPWKVSISLLREADRQKVFWLTALLLQLL